MLGLFANERQILLEKWLAGENLTEALGPFQSQADGALAVGGVIRRLQEAPKAIAAELERERRFDGWHEELFESAEFQFNGIELQTFLGAKVPAAEHERFTDFIFRKNGVSMDHATGKVRPSRPSLRRLVSALLRNEDEAIPATWLARLVQESPYHREMTADALHRNWRNWIQANPSFPRDKVIWGE